MKFQSSLLFCGTLSLLCIIGCGATSSIAPSTSAAASNPGTASPSPGASGSSSSGSGSGSGSSGSTSGGSGSGSSQGAAAFAYVGTANLSSAVYGFSIAADGSATPVSGSPVAGPSSNVITNSAFVFGTDGHNIASYARNSDGSLSQSSSMNAALTNAGGFPMAIQAMSLDHTGQTLYAMENAGSDDVYYVFFSVGADGKLTNTGKIGPSVDYTSPLVFSPNNNFAYGFGCFHANWDVTGFSRSADGTLVPLGSAATDSAIPGYAGTSIAQGYCPLAEAVSKGGYLAVAEVRNGTQTSGLAAFTINGDGSLTLVPNSTMANLLPSVNAMKFDPNGQYLAVAGNGGLQMYQLSSTGTFTPVGGVQAAGPNYISVQWDNDNHLYASSASGLAVFTSSQGVLTPAPGSPHSAGTGASLTVLPLQ